MPFIDTVVASSINFNPRLIWKIPKRFREILGKFKYLVIAGGRSSTKTQSVATFLIEESFYERDCIFLCGREYMSSIKDSVYSVFVKLINSPKYSNIKDVFTINSHEIINKKNNVKFIFKGFNDFSKGSEKKASNLAKTKSIVNIRHVWIDEAQTITENTLDILVPTGREFIVSYVNPLDKELEEFDFNKETKFIFTLNREKEEDPVITYFKDFEGYHFEEINLFDLESEFQNKEMLKLAKESEGKGNYNHVWLGQPNRDTTDSLFPFENFKHFEIEKINDFDYICIGVDPAGSNKKLSDNTGIVVVAYRDDKFYVLEDLSGKYSPLEWRKIITNAYDRWSANSVILETNYGGDLAINNIESHIFVIPTPARKSKETRAQPISVLYEEKLVYHAKGLSFLEKQLNEFTLMKFVGEGSPDRADALVHAMQHLADRYRLGVFQYDIC